MSRHWTKKAHFPPADAQQPLATCPGCGKQAYTSKGAAKAAARRLYPGVRMRAYQCTGTDWWHLTSQDAAHTTRMRDWRAGREAS